MASNQLHCLQSRGDMAAAQIEGWAQFFVFDSLNISSQNNCGFGYYKEFRTVDGNPPVQAVPNAKSCFGAIRWMDTYCPTSMSEGVEWDWGNFFWRLRAKEAYSYNDFMNVYKRACGGGNCTATPGWIALNNAATAQFGQNSAKAQAWYGQSVAHGIDH